ncbi:MAG: hypothetical protein LUC83_03835 [Clostridiales bacterium]|nr:hypothetical protein [Clostridiales bacterium]
MGRGLFVTGTGTDIGKTYVTGLIAGYFVCTFHGTIQMIVRKEICSYDLVPL